VRGTPDRPSGSHSKEPSRLSSKHARNLTGGGLRSSDRPGVREMAHLRSHPETGHRMARPRWRARMASIFRTAELRTATARLAGGPRRREMAIILSLLLVASVLSAAGFKAGGGTGAPGSDSPFAVARLSASNGPTSAAVPTLTPDPALLALQYSVPMAPDPTPVPTATPVPTPAPTSAPKKPAAPPRVYTFVALGDSLTAWPADPWPSRHPRGSSY
jgi:hypothetical protein